VPDTEPKIDIYELALELSRRVYTVIELAALERYFLRDTLDRKSTSVPLLVRQGLNTAEMVARRASYMKAHRAALDVATLLDVLAQRGTIESTALVAARDVARTLVAKLLPLTIPPPLVR
jgi:hypothetical protein